MKKKILLIINLTVLIMGYSMAQTTVYWRTDGPSIGGNWEWGSTCEASDDGQWYYNAWGGFRKRPDCFGIHDIYFDGNGINTMNLNSLEDYDVRRIFFTSNASQSRILNSDVGRILYLTENNGFPKIENLSIASHTINVAISLSNSGEINPVNGDLSFGGAIDNNGNYIDVYGSNSKILNIGSTLSGIGGITLKQNSTIIYSSVDKSYSGPTILDAGTLELQVSAPNTSVTVKNTATLKISGSNVVIDDLIIESGGIVQIEAGKSLTVNGNLTNNAAQGIVLLSPESHGPAGSLIIEGVYSGTGTLKAERHILSYSTSANGWHLLSSPVNNPSIANATNLAPGNADDFYAYSETTHEWLNYKVEGNGLTTMNNGKGFLVAYQNGSTKHMIGTPNTSSVAFSNLSITSGKGNGWHLLGNPFQSAITWNSANWNLTGISTTAKLMTNTGGFEDLGDGGIIPAMQGFWVQAVNPSNTITIPTTSRVHNSSNWLKSETNDKILLISHDVETGMLQKSRIRFNADATPDYDLLFDSRFMAWYAPTFYSIAGAENLSTNTLPEFTDELVIPFGFKKNGSSNFSIELAETIEGKTIYLTDLKTNTVHKLSENPIYAFTSAEGDDPNRFLLHFGLVSVGEQLPTETLQAYAYSNRLYVNSSLEKASLSVYDLQGRLLLQRQINEVGLQSVEMEMPAGVYIVRLQNTQQSKSVKIVVQ
jgi:hypothetical protein